MTTALLDRVRATLAFNAAATSPLKAVRVDVEDLSLLIALASTRPITRAQWDTTNTVDGPVGV